MTCPQCNTQTGCDFCEKTGNVEEILFDLYQLGFRRTENLKEYQIYLQKVLSHLETITITIVKSENTLTITKISSNGPSDLINKYSLNSVEKVIDFLQNY